MKNEILNKSEITEKLNLLLSNYQMYYQNLRSLHWNIKGKMFFMLHEKFEEFYNTASEVIDEIAEMGLVPDAVVLSVGGGGLLSGVVDGLQRNNLHDVPVLAVETKGAHSLALSIQQNRLAELDEISSIATTLGAKQVSQQAYNCCRNHDVTSHLASDLEAVTGCLTFLKEHRLLVEPACGASLSALITANQFFRNKQNVLVIVCGGAGVSIKQLESWKDSLSGKIPS